MDLEVVGRHALLFDDDATAAFVNSKDALVEWNSLQIDRYDVRHLLQSLPPLNRRRGASSPSSLEESQLDEERYLDLPRPPDDGGDRVQSSAAEENGGETTDARTYNSVAFSYGNADDVMEQKDSDAIGFLPPFPVPDTLLHCLPPMEKLHQIMARTALFVSKHGGQSEIVLRVKQGDNPTFGFLMPDHHLHPYFRFLVDHPELLSPDKSQDKDEKAVQEQNEKEDVAGGALSLLGSVYGSVEDEDADAQSSDSKDNEPGNSPDTDNVTPDHVAASLGPLTGKDEAAPRQQPPLTSKENFTIPKKTSSVNVVHSGAVKVKKRAGESSVKIPVSADKAKVSTNISSTSKSELIIVEPPSDMKRVIEKIVEYIMKNGKEFEAVLMEQDTTNRRFPFLLASNQYHPYYLKVLRNAQESKQAGKGYSSGQASGKRSAHDKDAGTALSKELAGYDLPYDNKKEKFRMVISGQKKDSQDSPQKPTPQQVGVSVDAVAAILEAARRGVRNPNLDILRPALVDAPVSSFGDRSSVSTSEASVAKVIASASEAGSSDASLTKEQKLKSERLKRAKMFAAMIKSGAVPRLSAEPPDSVSSGSVGSGSKSEKQNGSLQAPDASKSTGAEAVELAARETEGSSLPMDVDTSNKMENPEQKNSDDYFKDYKSKKKRHLRSRRVEDDDDDDDDGNSLEEGELDHKDNKKRHRSHHSSHRDSDTHKHRKRHSSSRDGESQHRRKHHSSSEDDRDRRKRSDKHSSRPERNSPERGRRRSNLVEDSGRISKGVSREASVDLLNDRWEGSAPSTIDAQPSDTTEVPSDLRAKVRAMLLATL